MTEILVDFVGKLKAENSSDVGFLITAVLVKVAPGFRQSWMHAALDSVRRTGESDPRDIAIADFLPKSDRGVFLREVGAESFFHREIEEIVDNLRRKHD